MKHWINGKSENGYGLKGVLLKSGERILSVVKTDNGIRFMEECDGHYERTYTTEEALELLDELKEWILKPKN